MTVVVRTTPTNSISVSQGVQGTSSVVVKKGGDLTLQGLSNVVSTDLQDGYTLVYDTTTNKWISQQVTVGLGDVGNIDGGTY